MEKTEQENFLDSKVNIQPRENETEELVKPEAVQLILPQEALNKITELERKYRETIERENK